MKEPTPSQACVSRLLAVMYELGGNYPFEVVTKAFETAARRFKHSVLEDGVDEGEEPEETAVEQARRFLRSEDLGNRLAREHQEREALRKELEEDTEDDGGLQQIPGPSERELARMARRKAEAAEQEKNPPPVVSSRPTLSPLKRFADEKGELWQHKYPVYLSHGMALEDEMEKNPDTRLARGTCDPKAPATLGGNLIKGYERLHANVKAEIEVLRRARVTNPNIGGQEPPKTCSVFGVPITMADLKNSYFFPDKEVGKRANKFHWFLLNTGKLSVAVADKLANDLLQIYGDPEQAYRLDYDEALVGAMLRKAALQGGAYLQEYLRFCEYLTSSNWDGWDKFFAPPSVERKKFVNPL